MERRAVLKGGLGLGLGLSLAPSVALGQDDPAALRPKEGDLLVKDGDAARKPLTPDDLAIGATQTMAWAMDPIDRTVRSGSRLNHVLLIRLDAGKLTPETRSRAADGVVAYTAICTHTGCEVDEWLAGEGSSCIVRVTSRSSTRATAPASSTAPRRGRCRRCRSRSWTDGSWSRSRSPAASVSRPRSNARAQVRRTA